MTTEIVIGERRCQNCQFILRPTANFCANCGHTSEASTADLKPQKISTPQPTFSLHWNELKRIALLFGLLLSTSLVLGLIGRGDSSPWPSSIASGIFSLIVLWFALNRSQDILPLLGVPKISARTAYQLTFLAVVFIALMTGYFALIEHAGIPILRATAEYRKAGWNMGWMLLFISVLPAVTEELAFRGVIQTSLERVVNERDAWLIQAALFSVLHLFPIIFPSHFLMGLCFGYLRLRSKSLYPGILLHACWNALVLCEELYWT